MSVYTQWTIDQAKMALGQVQECLTTVEGFEKIVNESTSAEHVADRKLVRRVRTVLAKASNDLRKIIAEQ